MDGKQEIRNRNWEDVHKWFLEIVSSDAGKIESLSDKGYDNWLLSLFALAGVDKIDLIMKKKKGVEYIQRVIELAYHEAGHAFIVWRHGWDFGRLGISLIPLYGSGVCQSSRNSVMKELTGEWREYSLVLKPLPPEEARLEFSLGGMAAQNIFRNIYSMKPLNIKIAVADYYGAIHNARRMRRPTLKKMEARMMLLKKYDEVSELMRNPNNWAAVTAIAEALLTYGYLDHTTACEIISRIDPPRQACCK